MSKFALEKKELLALGKTDASTPLAIGRWILDPLVMSDGSCRFSWRQYRFANVYRQSLDLEQACQAAGMTRESALRFLKRRDVDAWMTDRLQMQSVKRNWDAEGRWHAEGEKLYRQENVPRHRVEIWKEFGERHEPKKKHADEDLTAQKVIINVSPETVMAIREREKAMEAELIKPNDSEQRGNSESRKILT